MPASCGKQPAVLATTSDVIGRPAHAGRRHRRCSSRQRHPDLVGRDFTATAPNQLWVTDLTFVPTWAGVAYPASSPTLTAG
jgi:putative transposase